MELRVLLLGACVSKLDLVEHDRLRQRFGEDVRLQESNPADAEEHLENLAVADYTAVYVPKNVLYGEGSDKIMEIIGDTTTIIDYFAYADADPALGVMAQIVDTPTGIEFREFAL